MSGPVLPSQRARAAARVVPAGRATVTTAVVLGGGGMAGVAWEAGVLLGLAEAGIDLAGAGPGSRVDTLIGTSAGAIVATRISAGPGIEALYEASLQPVNAAPMTIDFSAINAAWAAAAAGARSSGEARARIGTFALAATTITAQQRRAEIGQLLPVDGWPARELIITAVSARTGAFRTFTRTDGVDLLDAVGASCAVPGVWPPVVIDGEPFMDGAVRSPTNATVAAGHTRVLVLAPLLPTLGGGITRELGSLGPDTASEVVAADAEAMAAFGENPLDPRIGTAAAVEGLRQGRAAATRVGALLA